MSPPQPTRGGLEERMWSSPSGVRNRAPAENECWCIWSWKNTSDNNKFDIFDTLHHIILFSHNYIHNLLNIRLFIYLSQAVTQLKRLQKFFHCIWGSAFGGLGSPALSLATRGHCATATAGRSSEPTATFLEICNGRLFRSIPLNVRTKLEARSGNLGSPWIRPRSLFSQIIKGLLFGWTLWIHLPNLKFVALPVPEIIAGTQKIWAVPGYAHAPFSPNF